MDKFYHHPTFGYHQGVPIGGEESTEITEAEFLAGIEAADLEEIDTTDINVIANKKLLDIQKEKCRIRDSGVFVEGVLFDTDESARIAYLEYLGLFQMNPNHVESNWKASENTFVVFTPDLFFKVIAARQINERNAFEWQKSRVQEIEAAVSANDKNALMDVSTIYQ